MKESALQKKVKKAILEKYPKTWYYHPCDKSRRGIPDIIMCVNSKFIAIELKRDLNQTEPTPLQNYNLLKIRSAGGFSFWADSVDGVMVLLEYYLC